jgi:hypothetical protein
LTVIIIPEGPVFGTWYNVRILNLLFKGSNAASKFFKNFLGPKKRVFGPVQIHIKNYFEIFSSISWGLCTGTIGEKVGLFGFSTGTESPRNRREKFFLGICTGSNTLLLDLNNF